MPAGRSRELAGLICDDADVSRFVSCPGGAEHWGPVGAAGLALWSRGGHSADSALLLQKRAAFTHQGGTWSIPGGALELGEEVHEAAIRETGEELVVDLAGLEVLGEVVDRCPYAGCRWTYTTIVAAVPGQPDATAGNWESELLQWTGRGDLRDAIAGTGDLQVHAGLRRTLPQIVTVAAVG